MRRVSEFFLLHDLRERARATAPGDRERQAKVHACAKQKRDAADALWIAGFPAEALRLAAEARDILEHGSTDELRAALPTLDSDVRPEHSEQFHKLQRENASLLGSQLGDWIDPAAIRRMQINRIAIAATIAVSLIAAAVIFLRTPRMLKAEASGQWDARYDASKAVDGSDRTDWLLPDKATGWLDVQIVPRRTIKRLHVTNARNVPYNDRATNEFHVDVYDKGHVVKQFDGKFDGFSADPTTRTFDIGAKADKVRLTVKSHHLAGGGFGEVSVDD